MKFKVIIISVAVALIIVVAALIFRGMGNKDNAETPIVTEEVEEAPVEDPEAYSNFEESKTEAEAVNPSGILAEYGYVSSYGMPREEEGDKVRSYLTGKLVDSSYGKRRPIAIMLNNIKEAQPMSGTSMADVFYECVVEGGLTRMMGIFENYDALDKIGSVRSCRNYFVYYALEFDSIYCHYGQSAYAMPLLEMDFVDNLSGLAMEGDTVYYRTNDRTPPHNAYASAKGIAKGIEIKGYDENYSPDYKGKFTFANDGDVITPSAAGAYDAVHVEPGYLINKPWFDYNPEDGKYYRFEYDEPQIDVEDNTQLAVDNIVLQYSAWEKVDENGYLAFDCHSGGKMTYISHGKAVDGSWQRFDGDTGAVRYFDTEKNEIVFNQGKTWILIIQDSTADKVVVR
ncbi:MAG: DUF3048 domain-containing protein [Lachnospiraceae bacterium]|nr:DUF3048 domain-containing protein [Lachnospiraceae bacterium]